MTAPALTHHEILGLVEPFKQRGRHVDLAASDRVARKLAFKPVDHPPAAGAVDATLTREVLVLESYGTGTFKLTRTLSRADGLQATVTAQGQVPAEMLARVEAVAPERHFRAGPGYVIARSYEFDSGDLLRLYRDLDDRDEVPVVIYHSHTATEAYPSRNDVAYASEPEAHYVLVSTRETGTEDGPYELRSFRIVDGQVTEEPISVLEG